MQYVWYVFNRQTVEIISYQPVTLYDMKRCYKVEYNCSYMIPFMCNEFSILYLDMFVVWCLKSLKLNFSIESLLTPLLEFSFFGGKTVEIHLEIALFRKIRQNLVKRKR